MYQAASTEWLLCAGLPRQAELLARLEAISKTIIQSSKRLMPGYLSLTLTTDYSPLTCGSYLFLRQALDLLRHFWGNAKSDRIKMSKQ
jgi:hypothetical protein